MVLKKVLPKQGTEPPCRSSGKSRRSEEISEQAEMRGAARNKDREIFQGILLLKPETHGMEMTDYFLQASRDAPNYKYMNFLWLRQRGS